MSGKALPFEFMAVYQWLNEYYEITTTKLIHRKGFIFRKQEMYDFKQVRLAGVKQGPNWMKNEK